MRRRRDGGTSRSGHDDAAAAAAAEHSDSTEGDDSNLLDQDDQEQLIRELEQGIVNQQRRLFQTFRFLCHAASALSFLLLVVDDLLESGAYALTGRLLRYAQGVASVAMHQSTVRFASRRGSGSGIIDASAEVKGEDAGGSGDEDSADGGSLPGSDEVLGEPRVIPATTTIALHALINLLLAVAAAHLTRPSPTDGADHSWFIFPVGLLTANLVTLAGALLIRWDQRDYQNQLKELKGSKYHYKSL